MFMNPATKIWKFGSPWGDEYNGHILNMNVFLFRVTAVCHTIQTSYWKLYGRLSLGNIDLNICSILGNVLWYPVRCICVSWVFFVHYKWNWITVNIIKDWSLMVCRSLTMLMWDSNMSVWGIWDSGDCQGLRASCSSLNSYNN